jgi:uncharacterized membrane protein YhaH (DUF805 family)
MATSLFPRQLQLTRKQYLIRWLIMVGIVIMATVFLAVSWRPPPNDNIGQTVATIVFWLSVIGALFYNIFGLSIPRLRNAGISLWALLLIFIPLGPLIMFIVCVVAREKVDVYQSEMARSLHRPNGNGA